MLRLRQNSSGGKEKLGNMADSKRQTVPFQHGKNSDRNGSRS